MSTIDIQGLRKEFSVPGGVEVAVTDFDLVVEDGEFVSLLGPSGCGKTTSLRCIAGLEVPTEGTIRFGDRDVTDLPANERNIAMMFQNIALYPHMTLLANIAYPLKVKGVSKDKRNERAHEVAKLLDIEDLVEKYPGDVSGGQRQRAALARTIIQDPVAFLMDEPLSDLDANLKIDIRKEIQRVQKDLNKPTIYVTHDQEEALTMSDKIVVMNDGRIMQAGTPDELYDEPGNQFVAGFIGNPNMNFLTCKLDASSGSRIEFEIDGVRFEHDSVSATDFDADSVVVGFRPEQVKLNPGDTAKSLSATVTLVERIDDRKLIRLDGPEGELRVTVSGDRSFAKGEEVQYTINLGRVNFFHPETGENLATTPRRDENLATN